MTSALLFAISLGLAAWAYRASRHATPDRIPGVLWRLGALVALWRILLELSRLPALAGSRDALLVARAAVSLLVWAHVAWLAAYGHRPGRVRTVFAVLAALAALGHQSWVMVGVLAMPALLSHRWLAALGTRARFGAALGALTLLALEFVRLRHSPEPTPGPAFQSPCDYASWAHLVALFYLCTGIARALAAFVSDPSLGIRTVRLRLTLSHSLVLLVPLAITVSLWLLTTWFGVGADRALQAHRLVAAEAGDMRQELVRSLRAPATPAAGLAAYAASRHAEWPHMGVWLARDGAVQRVAGDSVRSESTLAAWCASLDTLPASGIVDLQGIRFLGAAARDTVSGAAAVALVPVLEALGGMPSRVLGARLWMRPGSYKVSVAPAAGDTAGLASVRTSGRPPHLGASVTGTRPKNPDNILSISTTNDTLSLGTGDFLSDSAGVTGRAFMDGVEWNGGRWEKSDFLMETRVTFAGTTLGMFRNVRENPFSLVAIALLGFLVLLLVPVALFNFTLVRQLARSFMGPVAALREGTRALAASDHAYRIPVRGDDELWEAAGAFNTMAEGLERARELEKERDRLEHELDLARRIQRRLLPDGPPHVAGVEIAGGSEPAREVGGDYYDHIPLGDGRVLLVIADVSGKGVPAALLMSAFRASLMSQDAEASGPAEVARRLNDFLHRSVDPGKFVTAFLGFLDGRTGRFVYANAGHNPPVLLRRDGTVEWLATGGLILGIMPDSRFEAGEALLEPGDMLALYTDGVTEGADATHEQFGEDRLVAALQRLAGQPCAEIARSLMREVRAFEGAQGPADDLTVLVVRRLATSAS